MNDNGGESVIFNLSGRTDLIAFYYPWVKARLKAGFVDVRHPFDPHRVLRYTLDASTVDAFVICTKNPLPLVADPTPFLTYPTLVQVTLTPYGRDLEPGVPRKKEIIESVKKLAAIFGSSCVDVRYDPIIINEKYTVVKHLGSFEHLVSVLAKYVHVFIISFVDEYQNTKKHGISAPTYSQMEAICQGFGEIAKRYGVHVQTCGEAHDFSHLGVFPGNCLDPVHLTQISGKHIDWIKEKSKRAFCACADYRDIGAYNSCLHYCRYCYANFDESLIQAHYAAHDPQSSLLIGSLQQDDQIIQVQFKPRQITLF